MVKWQKEVALKLIDEKDKLIMEAKIMSSKIFVLENEIKRLNEELEKTKKKLKIERKSTLTLGRLARRIKYLGFGIVIGFFISCNFMNVV